MISISQDKSPAAIALDKVHEFYERMPYPAPLTTLDEHRELYKNPNRRRAQYHLLWPTEPLRENLEILIAGCGTSQAARYAMREADARVTAIDISDMSLRHTRDLQTKYDLKNLEIHQLRVEDVGKLGRTFDQIVCTGVLHHLPDPDLGLRALRDALRPGGAIQLMVYAPYGRAGIYMMQDYCRLLGVTTSEQDLVELGNTLKALPSNHPMANVMREAIDFNHPDALADALLHPLDRAYSVPQLYRWLESCGLSFGRWVEQAPYLPQCGLMGKTPHARRLASLALPVQHAAAELFRGTMVKHNLIAYRDDRRTEVQPINFVGDHWKEYVPIRVPWTVCVRERVPAGAVAVLINRAHTFTDLILTIDKKQDQLLCAINGKRTLGDIVKVAGREISERQAINFFERLWEYDQVVLDASQLTDPQLSSQSQKGFCRPSIPSSVQSLTQVQTDEGGAR